jgi:hypothetical protein
MNFGGGVWTNPTYSLHRHDRVQRRATTSSIGFGNGDPEEIMLGKRLHVSGWDVSLPGERILTELFLCQFSCRPADLALCLRNRGMHCDLQVRHSEGHEIATEY